MDKKLLRLPEVKSGIGLSRTTIYRRMAEGSFPKPIPIGGRLVAWDADDIEQWIADRIDEAKSKA